MYCQRPRAIGNSIIQVNKLLLYIIIDTNKCNISNRIDIFKIYESHFFKISITSYNMGKLKCRIFLQFFVS